jgi:hypothetical protein
MASGHRSRLAQQTVPACRQILPHRATNAAAGELKDSLIRDLHQQMAYTDGAEPVDEAREARTSQLPRSERDLPTAAGNIAIDSGRLPEVTRVAA